MTLSVDEMDAVVVEPEHKNAREDGIDVDKKMVMKIRRLT